MKVLDAIVKMIEASICYVGAIHVSFLVVIGRFVVAVNSALYVINLILYIFCGYLKDINVFLWWGDTVVPVD